MNLIYSILKILSIIMLIYKYIIRNYIKYTLDLILYVLGECNERRHIFRKTDSINLEFY